MKSRAANHIRRSSTFSFVRFAAPLVLMQCPPCGSVLVSLSLSLSVCLSLSLAHSLSRRLCPSHFRLFNRIDFVCAFMQKLCKSSASCAINYESNCLSGYTGRILNLFSSVREQYVRLTAYSSMWPMRHSAAALTSECIIYIYNIYYVKYLYQKISLTAAVALLA